MEATMEKTRAMLNFSRFDPYVTYSDVSSLTFT